MSNSRQSNEPRRLDFNYEKLSLRRKHKPNYYGINFDEAERPSKLGVPTFPLTLPNFTQEMCRSTKCLSWHSYTLHAHEILLIIIIMMLTLRRMFYLQVLSLNAHLWVAINAEALFYWLINEGSGNIFIKAAHTTEEKWLRSIFTS